MSLLRLGVVPPTVTPRATVLEAAQLMTEHRVGAIVVVDDQRLVGIFTERDLMSRVVARGADPASTPIGMVMTEHVHSVPDETSVAQAAVMMRANNFRHLVIVHPDGRIRGMVSLRDLLYDMMKELEAKVDDLEGFLMEDSGGG